MPYVPPTTSVHSPTIQTIPLPPLAHKTADSRSDTNDNIDEGSSNDATGPSDDTTSPVSRTNDTADQTTIAIPAEDERPPPTGVAHASPSPADIPIAPSTVLPLPPHRPSRTVSLDIIDRTPPIPSTMDALASNFASGGFGLGHGTSDTAVHTLKDISEGETIQISQPSGSEGDGMADMPKLPGTGTDGGVPMLTSLERDEGAIKLQGSGEADRDEDDQGVPDLVPSRSLSVSDVDTQGLRDGSSTSLDTMNETPSPVSPNDNDGFNGAQEEGTGEVVIVQQGEEEDPKLVALHKYKEGLYTYTVSLQNSRPPL